MHLIKNRIVSTLTTSTHRSHYSTLRSTTPLTQHYTTLHYTTLHCTQTNSLPCHIITTSELDTRAEYYRHIVLSGGSSMYPGLPSRLEKDIKDRYLNEILKGAICDDTLKYDLLVIVFFTCLILCTICLSLCLSVCVSVYLCVCLYILLSVRLIALSLSLSVSLYLCVCLSIPTCMCMSIYLSLSVDPYLTSLRPSYTVYQATRSVCGRSR